MLLADIPRRNNFGKLVVGEKLTYHIMYSATLCPGPCLKSKLYTIAVEANKINSYIETVQQNLLDKTFYIQDCNSNKYINIDSSSGAARSSANVLNLDIAGDKNSQRWTIVSTINGVKMVSNFKGKTTLVTTDNNSCGFVSNSEGIDDLDMEIISYTNNTISYSDNIHYIKLKNQNLFLAAINGSLSWVSAFSLACLWKFKSKGEAVPEIMENKKIELANLIIDNYQLNENPVDITRDKLLVNETVNGKTIITPEATITSKYQLFDSHTIVGKEIEGITIDYDTDGNGTYSVDANAMGLKGALLELDINGADNAYQLAANIGNKFPGGEFYFTFKPMTNNSAEFEIIYNFSLLPDDKTIDSKISFKATYVVTFTSNPPKYEFVSDPEVVVKPIYVAAFIVIVIGVVSGGITVSTAGLMVILLPALNLIGPILATT